MPSWSTSVPGCKLLALSIGFFGDVNYDACAADLQYGINTVGLPEAMAVAASVLDREGVVLMPCPDCGRFDVAPSVEVLQHLGRSLSIPVEKLFTAGHGRSGGLAMICQAISDSDDGGTLVRLGSAWPLSGDGSRGVA